MSFGVEDPTDQRWSLFFVFVFTKSYSRYRVQGIPKVFYVLRSRASGYTTLLVKVPAWFPTFPILGQCRILMEDGVRIRDIATYKSPWVDTGVGRYRPTWSNVWPCALLIVIAKARRIGNCVRLNFIANCSSIGIRLMRGISTMSPMLTPVAISASMT